IGAYRQLRSGQRERDELGAVLARNGQDDELPAVDGVRERQTADGAWQLDLLEQRAGRLVVRTQDGPPAPALGREEQRLRHASDGPRRASRLRNVEPAQRGMLRDIGRRRAVRDAPEVLARV